MMPEESSLDLVSGCADRLRSLAHQTLDRRPPIFLDAAIRRGCWIYGAGGYGQIIRRLLAERGIEIRGFVDLRADNPALSQRVGATVVTPAQFAHGQAKGTTLIVGLHNFAADQAPIVKWGRSMGFSEIILPAELPDMLGQDAGSYWLTGRGHAVSAAYEIECIAARLADRRSVEVLLGAARFRITGDIAEHPASDLPSQYFPPDVPLTQEPLRAVDGGAFTGDIHEAASRIGASFAEWWAFEPDPANFVDLVATAARVRVPRTTLFPCGLGDRCEQIRFTSGEAAGSHVGEGDSIAQIVALDAVLPGILPNYVKLDIEGFERQAIAGMADTLERSRPHIAMSIYHKPEDLWELPLLIHELLPQSKLYIRQHGFNGFDTVLYAVP